MSRDGKPFFYVGLSPTNSSMPRVFASHRAAGLLSSFARQNAAGRGKSPARFHRHNLSPALPGQFEQFLRHFIRKGRGTAWTPCSTSMAGAGRFGSGFRRAGAGRGGARAAGSGMGHIGAGHGVPTAGLIDWFGVFLELMFLGEGGVPDDQFVHQGHRAGIGSEAVRRHE